MTDAIVKSVLVLAIAFGVATLIIWVAS